MPKVPGGKFAEVVDVIVVGAGQAGLAAGYYLKQTKLEFRIVDGARRVGDAWRNRYDSLRLFTPREFSSLPGLALSGDPKGRPDRIEFADYLEAYSSAFQLPVCLNSPIERIRRRIDGIFELSAVKSPPILARNVILATGGYPGAVQPAERKNFGPKIYQTDASAYRNPQQLPAGSVLIIGDGAAGRDFATELLATHEVYLSGGRDRKLFPDRFMGKSLWWWLRLLGFFKPRHSSQLSRMPMALPDIVPSREQLAGLGVKLVPKFMKARGSLAWFEDGRSISPRSVIWAVGHKENHAWMDVQGAKDKAGNLLHTRGVSPVPGLFYVGRPWQSNMSSSLIIGAGPDAAYVVKELSKADKTPNATR